MARADDAGRSRRWWVLGGLAAVAVLAVSVVVFVSLLDRRDPALEVGAWSYSRDELEADLAGVSGNEAYRYVREQEGRPLPEPSADGYDADLVAEVLTDRLTFRLAEVALAERGGSVAAPDREEARRTLAGALVAGPQLAGGPDATLDAVLDQFGTWGPTLTDGVAVLAALGRVLVDEAVAAGTPEEELDRTELLLDALRAAGEAEGVVVADDLGTYDPVTVTVLAVGTSAGELAPFTPDEGPVGPSASAAPTTVPSTEVPAGDEGP